MDFFTIKHQKVPLNKMKNRRIFNQIKLRIFGKILDAADIAIISSLLYCNKSLTFKVTFVFLLRYLPLIIKTEAEQLIPLQKRVCCIDFCDAVIILEMQIKQC